MPHLAAIDWDYADRMQHADLGGGGDVWFVYDSAGNRVRKVRVNQAGTQSEERVYLGGVELYRERQAGVVQRERHSLHVADDSGRVCLVETLTVDGGAPVAAAANVSRYQYGNHLGSASLELDGSGQLISYEEFHPYGSTAYRAANSTIEVSASRYRYTGQERDEETGLDLMGARYYASWLGRWTAADPIGLGDGVNRYAYVRGRPTVLRDPSGTKGELRFDFSDEGHVVHGSQPRVGLGAVPPEQLSTEGDPAFDDVSLAVDRPSSAQMAASRNAEFLRGQIQLGKARPPGLPEDAVPIKSGGVVEGFVSDLPGTGGDIRRVHNIAGEPIGQFAQGIEQDYTIELAALDILAIKGALGLGRAAFAAALERQAVRRALKREARRFAAENAAGFRAGATPGRFADALIEGQARVAAARAQAGRAAHLEASAAGRGADVPTLTIPKAVGADVTKVRVRHFTNKGNLGKIEEAGLLRAGDQGSVFTVRAKGRPGSPRDVEKKLGIGKGRGNAFVEFDAAITEFEVVKNPLTGAREFVFKGNVELAERNAVFRRNR